MPCEFPRRNSTVEDEPAVVWDAATLDRYIAKPTDVVAKDKMLFGGVKEENDRRKLIAYLKSASR